MDYFKWGDYVNKHIEELKEKKIQEIIELFGDNITGINDLTGGKDPSLLFYVLAEKLYYLLDPEDMSLLTYETILKKRKFNKIIKALGPLFISNKQVFENRNTLLDENDITPDTRKELPVEPVIWVSNHSFKDDGLATVLSATRSAYLTIGSTPYIYNTLDGFSSYLNGSIYVNRKIKASRDKIIEKSCKVLNEGSDLIIFPEGVWNKEPDRLLIDFWPGIYRIAKETNSKVVPVVHYLNDLTNKNKKEKIHTVIDDPMDITHLDEEEALKLLRDKIATWVYLMIERYGKTTREETLNGLTYDEYWEKELENRVKTALFYDKEIELSADYRPKSKLRPEDVYESIANIENITRDNILEVEQAKTLIKKRKNNDFQRRF